MKILFLTAGFKTPSVRFRVLQNLKVWHELGVEAEVVKLPRRNRERLGLLARLPIYDIVFLQKRLMHSHSFRVLRWRARLLVYDFDDAVMFDDSNAAALISPRKSKRFATTISGCDAVCAGNDYLAGQALEAGARQVTVVPTGIDIERYQPALSADAVNDKVQPLRLGWIGSQPNLIYLKALAVPINRLYEQRQDFKLTIICDSFCDDFHCPVECVSWSEDIEVKALQGLDIGLMPLAEDPWTKGKCALKLLQYMACGLPSVATETAVTKKIIREGENGLLAANVEEMVVKIAWLMDHQRQMLSIGVKARQSVIGTYDTRTVAGIYADLFRDLIGSSRS
ncbi:MAG: glycosyltransferase family 4 protein [Deltaproteobacteria bacterium]|nr:glycosyltransferase family 4 protein [Deltaproteobacteria bacterium]